MSEQIKKVLSNVAQSLTSAEKAQARANIGCCGAYTAGTGIAIVDNEINNIAPNVKSDWNAAAGAAGEILNKPSIPTVNDGTLTLQVNGTDLATFSANQSGDVTANITGVGGAEVVTRYNSQAGYVETPVSKVTFDTDFHQIIADNTEIGVFGPMPQNGDTGKMVVVNGDTLEYQTVPQTGSEVQIATGGGAHGQIVYTTVDSMSVWPSSGLIATKLNGQSSQQGYIAPYVTSAYATDKVFGLQANNLSPEWLDMPKGTFFAYWSGYSTGHSNTTYDEIKAAVDAGKDVILYVQNGAGTVFYPLDNINSTRAMFSRTINTANTIVTVQELDDSYSSTTTWLQGEMSAGTGININSSNEVSWAYSVGRNLWLNQNNAIQTKLPGGIWNAPSQSNNFERLTNTDAADFVGAYRLLCRHNPNDTYELAIGYTSSGMSSTITFVGTETVVGINNSVTTNQAVYVGESAIFTPVYRFGYSSSTVFDPTQHKAIYYSGIAQIGPTSDCKIAIWNDNGTVKVSMTSIEVGKVGATN